MKNGNEIIGQLSALCEGVPYLAANLSNASALLYDALPRLNWAGFYLLRGGALWLGPFQGKPACVRIAPGKGVCGRAAEEDRTLVVPDVHVFPGHIACDGASRSEIVVPLHRAGKVVGVLDLDSPEYDRFTEEDRELIERFASKLEELLEDQWEQE
ncbi:MAG: GAF domain-containing protein [Clostridia bacterium]|nr:GAF domain-containing protein [Clostridia bacterium]